MICVFPSDATDFAGNSQCVLTPTACTVTETLNGEWELSMTHPLDERDKWTYLQVGCILRTPVPAAMMPRVSLFSQTTGWSVYTITTKSGEFNLRSGSGTNYKRLGQYAKGREVVPRLPPFLAKQWHTSEAVRLRLSVMVLTITVTPLAFWMTTILDSSKAHHSYFVKSQDDCKIIHTNCIFVLNLLGHFFYHGNSVMLHICIIL